MAVLSGENDVVFFIKMSALHLCPLSADINASLITSPSNIVVRAWLLYISVPY